jgi:hypothetical protein
VRVTEGVFGDVNGDLETDAIDVQVVVNQVLGTMATTEPADLNGDASVDAIDVQLMVNVVLGTF